MGIPGESVLGRAWKGHWNRLVRDRGFNFDKRTVWNTSLTLSVEAVRSGVVGRLEEGGRGIFRWTITVYVVR